MAGMMTTLPSQTPDVVPAGWMAKLVQDQAGGMQSPASQAFSNGNIAGGLGLEVGSAIKGGVERAVAPVVAVGKGLGYVAGAAGRFGAGLLGYDASAAPASPVTPAAAATVAGAAPSQGGGAVTPGTPAHDAVLESAGMPTAAQIARGRVSGYIQGNQGTVPGATPQVAPSLGMLQLMQGIASAGQAQAKEAQSFGMRSQAAAISQGIAQQQMAAAGADPRARAMAANEAFLRLLAQTGAGAGVQPVATNTGFGQ